MNEAWRRDPAREYYWGDLARRVNDGVLDGAIPDREPDLWDSPMSPFISMFTVDTVDRAIPPEVFSAACDDAYEAARQAAWAVLKEYSEMLRPVVDALEAL